MDTIKAFPEYQPVIDEITAVCNSLGKLDENDGTYMKDRDCKPCLKEIARHLAADSKSYVVRSTLGAMNIVKSDIIPLMVQYCEFTDGDSELFATILRLATNLTSSALLLFENQEIPKEPEKLEIYRKHLHYLYTYKEAFANDEGIWSTLNVHLRHNREDEITFERLIILIRNILHIPVDSTSDFGIHPDFDAHDMCLYRMDKSGMFETIIQLAQGEKGSEFCFHLTEIVYLMLRDKNPETIARARPYTCKRKLSDDDADKKRYAELSARDRREKRLKGRADPTIARFKNSNFVITNCKSSSGNPMVVRNAPKSMDQILLDAGKTDLRKAKNARPLSSETSMSISDNNTKTSQISFGLKTFCKQFIENVFNNYMQQIKHNLIQKKANDHDESYYFWAVQFFSAFNRCSEFDVEKISETLSMSTLHFIQISITNYQDSIKLDKKTNANSLKRLHLAVRAYKEILSTIDLVQAESESRVVETIKKICSDLDYSSLLLNLLLQYDPSKHSMHYLKDLVKTNQVFLKLYAKHSKSQDILMRYFNPDVLRAYLKLLEQYKTNDSPTNLAIIEFLERVVEYGQQAQLFQASLFRCLLEIMGYDERYDAFAKQLFESFGAMANKRRWMFQELLFWKSSNDILEIDNAINPPAPVSPQPADEPYVPAPSDDEADERLSVISELPSLSDAGEIIDPPEKEQGGGDDADDDSDDEPVRRRRRSTDSPFQAEPEPVSSDSLPNLDDLDDLESLPELSKEEEEEEEEKEELRSPEGRDKQPSEPVEPNLSQYPESLTQLRETLATDDHADGSNSGLPE